MSKYMRYETGARAGIAPLSVKRSNNINKLTRTQIVWHLYKRDEILILQLAVAVIFTWAVITKLG